ncbi:acyltransferase [Sphingomonas bacterium]|uniref:acyltransferase family protein n=1 Tax=Sphingomonas bacterium TaxID=1895847 RepID=UPI00262CEA2E|nr:acyltransferase [Sphingomonas bacterium]MDB5679729.1 hypothetical protein [Sphingomonas bacterium]
MRGQGVTAAEKVAPVRLDNIDLLRAVAIVSVLLYHFTSRWHAQSVPFRFDLGWAGVDLFFMVSGFCIFMTLERSRTLAAFWARRFARLQPAYMAGVVLTFALVSWFGLPGYEVTPTVAAGNLVWFDVVPSWGFVDDAYWSLIVEAKFYFWFGLIYFLMRGRNVSLAWAAFAAMGSVLTHAEGWGWPAGHVLTVVAQSVLIGPFAPMFLVGSVCYEFRDKPARSAILPAVVALALLPTSPRYAGVIWLGPLIAVFAAIVFRLTWLRLPRAVTLIGLTSYSLYLVHQYVGLVIIRELAPVFPALFPRILIATAMTVALAIAMFYTIELRWQKSLAALIEPIVAGAIGWLPRTWRVRAGRDGQSDKPGPGDAKVVDAARGW